MDELTTKRLEKLEEESKLLDETYNRKLNELKERKKQIRNKKKAMLAKEEKKQIDQENKDKYFLGNTLLELWKNKKISNENMGNILELIFNENSEEKQKFIGILKKKY